jgi:hypothetical protein
MKNPDHAIIGEFSRGITDLGNLILDLSRDEKWLGKRQDLLRQANWYLHQPEWFLSNVTKIRGGNSYDSLIEAVAKIGLKSEYLGEDDLARDAIEIINKFSNDYLEKGEDKYGYTEPRIMERACYIGILAMKQGKTSSVELLKIKIRLFEKAYTNKWFSDLPKGFVPTSPTKNQLKDTVMGLLRKWDNFDQDYMGIMDDSENALFKLVDRIDIEKFIFDVWGVFEVGGELEISLKTKNKKSKKK